MVRLRAICCSTVTRAAAFCSEPVEPTSARPGSTRKRVMPNSRSSRPPSWLEMASERMAEALEVPLPEVPPLRTVDSDVGLPQGQQGDDIVRGEGGIRAISESELACRSVEIQGDLV